MDENVLALMTGDDKLVGGHFINIIITIISIMKVMTCIGLKEKIKASYTNHLRFLVLDGGLVGRRLKIAVKKLP